MVNKVIFVVSPAIYSFIGMWTFYLFDPDWVISGSVIGLVLGLGIAFIALSGEKSN